MQVQCVDGLCDIAAYNAIALPEKLRRMVTIAYVEATEIHVPMVLNII